MRLYSYLDDTYLVLPAQLATAALHRLAELLEPLGLELNGRKTHVWSPTRPQAVPPELRAHFVPALPVLGTHLRARGDVADAPFELGQNNGLEQAAGRLTQLWDALRPLGKRTVGEHGLSLQATGSLLRTYAGAASQHVLRALLASEAEAARYDATLAGYWEELARRPLDATAREFLSLPLKLFDATLLWATARRAAAF